MVSSDRPVAAPTPHSGVSVPRIRGKPKAENPITSAVRQWLEGSSIARLLVSQTNDGDPIKDLVAQAPKRWVVYEPMALLPSGSFTSTSWADLLGSIDDGQRDSLWAGVLGEISKKTAALTHLAVNEGIPLHVAQAAGENILRSPSGLRVFYGDFGPAALAEGDGSVTEEDLDRAFWVSTRQNGIYQTWAPRWTMFSRGNVKEKARLLSFHDDQPDNVALASRVRTKASLRDAWAVDLYGGIGYFVFSYAKLGMNVLCWEINPWSVEGLRRGAEGNGWSVKVVRGKDLERPTEELVTGQERIVVFLEDNKHAERRVDELRAHDFGLEVSHVNCGLLPRSDDTWRAARRILGRGEGWLHLHENVGSQDIQSRRQEVQQMFDGWTRGDEVEDSAAAEVEHVELVKTFAPDVWHCVFDVHITRV